MAERKVSVRLAVVDGGRFKAELAELGAAGNQALGAIGAGASTAAGVATLVLPVFNSGCQPFTATITAKPTT